MAPRDAQTFWMSARIPSDQFLVYAFDGEPTDHAAAVVEVLFRARSCTQLRLQVRDDCPLRYPRWVAGDVDDEHVVVHRIGELDWQACLDAVTRLSDEQLDLRRMSWRLHVFGPVHAVPGAAGGATVAVLQIGHTLGDGIRSAALAGVLFGRAATVSAVAPWPRRGLVGRSIAAAKAQRQLERDVAAGLLPPPTQPRPVLATNDRPTGVRMLRTLVRHRAQLPGPTVTVGVLAAISAALSGYLSACGDDVATLGAEVPMAKGGVPHAHNHFRNVGIELYPELSGDRAARIAADLDNQRRRGAHPAFVAGDRATAAVPAPLLRWGVAQFDIDARSTMVTGNTVVSSVNRGAADLCFGGCPVLLTSGYPALSPMMGLTHGVHGIGDTVAISAHTAESVMPDVDDYVDRLDAALRG
jgi:hypothetical protein